MADFQEMFERQQAQKGDSADKMEFSEGETANFKKAFDDPEFRRMFTEYMDEMQDPNNRQVYVCIYICISIMLVGVEIKSLLNVCTYFNICI
jgi:hypothetical protein